MVPVYKIYCTIHLCTCTEILLILHSIFGLIQVNCCVWQNSLRLKTSPHPPIHPLHAIYCRSKSWYLQFAILWSHSLGYFQIHCCHCYFCFANKMEYKSCHRNWAVYTDGPLACIDLLWLAWQAIKVGSFFGMKSMWREFLWNLTLQFIFNLLCIQHCYLKLSISVSNIAHRGPLHKQTRLIKLLSSDILLSA